MQPLRSLWAVLDRGARRDFLMLALLGTLAGLLETLSVGLIIPFMAAATNTGPFGGSRIWTEKWQAQLTSMGVGEESFTLVLALMFVVGNLVANGTVVYYQYLALYVVNRHKASLGTRLLDELANKSLGWYEAENSGELSKSVMTDVDRVMLSVSSLAQLLGIGVRVSILAFFFMLAQLRLAIVLSTSLVIAFYVVFRYIHRPLVAAGEQGLKALAQMYELAGDVFGGTRELKATRSEAYFVQRFRKAADASIYPEVVRGMPAHVTRMGLETSILTTIILILVYFRTRDGSLANGLPILSAYAIAGIRLLPSLQQGLFHWVQIRYLNPSVFRVEELLTPEAGNHREVTVLPIEFKHSLTLKEVSFAYTGASSTIDGVTLQILKNQRVALVGSTGAGKSTLMDLLLGLRSPSHGNILIDEATLAPATIPP